MKKTIATLGLLSSLQGMPASAQEAQTAPTKVVFQSGQEAREATVVRLPTIDEAKARQQELCAVFDTTIHFLNRTLNIGDRVECIIIEKLKANESHSEPVVNLSVEGVQPGTLKLETREGHIFVTATLLDQSVLSFTDPVDPEDLNGLPQEWKR